MRVTTEHANESVAQLSVGAEMAHSGPTAHIEKNFPTYVQDTETLSDMEEHQEDSPAVLISSFEV